jgi:hypothetical protein
LPVVPAWLVPAAPGAPVPDCPPTALAPAWPDTPPVPFVPPFSEDGAPVDEQAVTTAASAIIIERT